LHFGTEDQIVVKPLSFTNDFPSPNPQSFKARKPDTSAVSSSSLFLNRTRFKARKPDTSAASQAYPQPHAHANRTHQRFSQAYPQPHAFYQTISPPLGTAPATVFLYDFFLAPPEPPYSLFHFSSSFKLGNHQITNA